MLTVKTPEEVYALIQTEFSQTMEAEWVPLSMARGRVLHGALASTEYVPGFHRSTVDGYAVRAEDTFGCSDAMPAMLPLRGEVLMGEAAKDTLMPGGCVAVPTGGAVPVGADAVAMLEYVEDYGDGTVGICKSVAPGENMIFKGDDVYPGKLVLPEGRLLTAQDIGALAAMGIMEVPVRLRPCVGILSTGNELVGVEQQPGDGQIRDVNSAMLCAAMEQFGAKARTYGIIRDDARRLAEVLKQALKECDVVLISGGSSVGMKDVTCRVIEEKGTVLFHGIAIKPGKPTIFGKVEGKPVIGLPGHPAAAFFVTQVFVKALLAQLCGRTVQAYTFPAILTETVGANHGRTQYTGVSLRKQGRVWYAQPIRGKSGLITTLANTDGYFAIPRDCEGVAAGATIEVTLYAMD